MITAIVQTIITIIIIATITIIITITAATTVAETMASHGFLPVFGDFRLIPAGHFLR